MERQFYQDKAKEFKKMERILKAIANPIRLAIIDVLRKEGPLTVRDLCDCVGLRQAVASSYLRKMYRIGILGFRKEGRCVFYYIKNNRVLDIIDCLSQCSRR